MISFILLVVGGLNWLLVALLEFNVAEWLAILIGVAVLESAIYVLVGLSAIFEVVTHKNRCKECSSGSGSTMM